MKAKITLFFLMVFLASNLVAGIYIDSLKVLQQGEVFSFYTYDTKEITVSIYKIEDGFDSYKEIMRNQKPFFKENDRIANYKIIPSENWSREEIPFYFFENTGSYLVKITANNSTVFSVVERTDIDGIAFLDENRVYLKLWNTFTGKNVNFGNVFTGNDAEILLGSLSENGFYSDERKNLVDKILFVKTPDGNSFIFIDDPAFSAYKIDEILLFNKPLYKPGEKVSARLLLHDRAKSVFIKNGIIEYKIIDPLGREKLSVKSDLSESNGINIEYQTEEEDKRGHYEIEFKAEINGEVITFSRYFELSDYMKPPFAVKLDNLKRVYSLDELLQFEISADYYYGQGLSEGNAHITLEKIPYSFYDFYYTGGQIVDIRTTSITDGKGYFSYGLKEKERAKYKVEVNVVDLSGREVSEVTYIQYVPSDMDIIVENSDYWINKGDKFRIQIKTELLQKTENPENRDLRIVVKDSEKDVFLTQDFTVEPGNPFYFDKEMEKPGYFSYEIIDLKYPENIVHGSFFVFSSDYAYTTDEDIKIIADKPEYYPGDIATLKVVSSFSDFNVLLLVDFGNSFIYKDLYMKEGYNTISFEIPPNVARNSLKLEAISFYNGKRLSMTENIPIKLTDKEIEIKLSVPEKTVPGEEINVVVESTGKNNDGIVGCISIVDQAIIDLYGSDDWGETISSIFTPADSYLVFNFNNPYYFRNLEISAANLSFEEPETLAQTKAAAEGNSAKVRSDFSDTALWIPVISMDEVTSIPVQLPEDLTTWNVRLFANDMSGRVGYVSDRFITTLPVTVNSIFPKFLTETDKVSLGINAGNYSGADDDFEITLKSCGVEISTVESIKDGTNKIVWFDFSVPELYDSSEIEFELSVVGDVGSDSMIFSLPLKKRIYDIEKGTGGILGVQGKLFEFTAKTETSMEISFNTNLKTELKDSVEYLIKYPYGCTEQTVSSFLPALAFLHLNEESDSNLKAKISDITDKALKRIYSYQHYDGGWGWWKNDDSQPFMTAYVMYTFSIMSEMNIEFNRSVFEIGLSALKKMVAEKDNEYTPFCNYVIKRIDKDFPVIFKSQKLDSKLFYALSLSENDNPAALKILQELISQGVKWNEFFKINFGSESYFMNDLQLNALLLSLMNELDYDGIEKNLLVNYLFRNRDGSYWYSTKDTAFVVMALSSIASSDEEFEIIIKGNLLEYSENLDEKMFLNKNTEVVSNIVLNPGETLSLNISGSNGIFWKIKWLEKWDFKDYKPSEDSEFKRNIEKKVSIKVSDGENDFIKNLYVPFCNKILPHILSSSDIDANENNNFAKIKSFKFETIKEGENYYYSLYVDDEFMGLTFSEEVRVVGFKDNCLQLSKNPFNGADGRWNLYFIPNEGTLKLGDIIRISNIFDIENEFKYAAFVEEIPACFVQAEDDDMYYYDKFLMNSYDSLWWYTSNTESKYDSTLSFYEFLSKGVHVENNYYKIICSGEFMIPPSKMFEMYDFDIVYTTEPVKIKIK